MKQIKAYMCSYCKKLSVNRTYINKHEKICFQNEESKSCITCKHLTGAHYVENSSLNGRKLTDHEIDIMAFKVPGTYEAHTGYYEADYNELNEEYRYLYDAEFSNYCGALHIKLAKLKTQCCNHENKI